MAMETNGMQNKLSNFPAQLVLDGAPDKVSPLLGACVSENVRTTSVTTDGLHAPGHKFCHKFCKFCVAKIEWCVQGGPSTFGTDERLGTLNPVTKRAQRAVCRLPVRLRYRVPESAHLRRVVCGLPMRLRCRVQESAHLPEFCGPAFSFLRICNVGMVSGE